VAYEPLSCHKAAVLTVLVKMPTGDDEFSPPDQSGIAIGSALVVLGLLAARHFIRFTIAYKLIYGRILNLYVVTGVCLF